MNFLGFRPNAFIISKKIHLHFFELIKNEPTLKIRYYNHLSTSAMSCTCIDCPLKNSSRHVQE
jgi:hypothetical protein